MVRPCHSESCFDFLEHALGYHTLSQDSCSVALGKLRDTLNLLASALFRFDHQLGQRVQGTVRR